MVGISRYQFPAGYSFLRLVSVGIRGGIKGGMTYGETDEYGYRVTKDKMDVHDMHANMLHLMGIDHEKLTYRFSGRDIRLTDVHGRVIPEIMA